jgi:hypothetical protein
MNKYLQRTDQKENEVWVDEEQDGYNTTVLSEPQQANRPNMCSNDDTDDHDNDE